MLTFPFPLPVLPSGRPFEKGFSLLELMLALTIFALLLVFGGPSFTTWVQNTQVRTVSESVQNGLQITRNEALRRNSRVAFTLNQDTSWSVEAIIPGAANEAVQSRSKGESASDRITAALKLSNDDTPTTSTLTFNGLGRIQESPYLSQVDIQSSLSGTKALRIQISAGGQVRLCDPDVPVANTQNPRRCL